MEKCKREKCFGNIKGCCYVLTDTTGQDKCRFYREDLNYERIMKETTFKGEKNERPSSVFFGER